MSDIQVIDVSAARTSKQLYLLLKDNLQFPDHYGENWDAFWDVITDEGGLPDIVEFVGWDWLSWLNILFREHVGNAEESVSIDTT